MIQSIAKKDQRGLQMESDLKEHSGCLQGLPEAMVLSPLQRAFRKLTGGRFPGVEGKVVSLGFIHKLFGQRNK